MLVYGNHSKSGKGPDSLPQPEYEKPKIRKTVTLRDRLNAMEKLQMQGKTVTMKTIDAQLMDHEQEDEKLCVICNRWLPLSDFRKSSKSLDGYARYCKKCGSKIQAEKRRKYPDYYERIRKERERGKRLEMERENGGDGVCDGKEEEKEE